MRDLSRIRRSIRIVLGLLCVLLAMAAKGKPLFPHESDLSISSVIPALDGVVLQWHDSGTAAYTVETVVSFGSNDWKPVPGNVWPISLTTWKDTAPLQAGGHFFRIASAAALANRGALLSATPLRVLSTNEIQNLYASAHVVLPVTNAVHAYKVIYETVNPFNLRTVASGLILVPDGLTNNRPLASYQHGTLVNKAEVPSNLVGAEPVVGVALAAEGYVAVLPDYIGLGESPGLHPFVHAKSEATAVVDLLRAARLFCAERGIGLNGQLFLIGYSEGGHATMAAHREIETYHSDEFHITASAPMAGPYDLSGATMNDFFSGRAMPNPYYFIYLLAAYQSIYHVAGSLGEMLRAPFDRTLPLLLDGKHDGSDLNRAMGTAYPMTVFTPEQLDSLQHDPNHPLRAALRDNDVYDWTPRAPLRMYHCAADEDVVFANSQVALDRFHARGATQVELFGADIQLDHGSCAPLALIGAKLWFDSFRH